ncbi:MAG: hypothetical protein NUK65_13855, partial [Firmicutes bacterium]|nr:hypothetical protein [Bacillota bacterium]
PSRLTWAYCTDESSAQIRGCVIGPTSAERSRPFPTLYQCNRTDFIDWKHGIKRKFIVAKARYVN